MRKIFDYQGCFKKVLVLFLVGITFFSTISNVYASMLTIENVSNQFDKSTIIQGLAQWELTFTSKVNTIDKTLDIYGDDEKVFSFTYGDDYIEYNNRSAVVTQENCTDDFVTGLWLFGIMESVFVLSGYENKTLSEEAFNTDIYDTYGIQFETESYNFSGTGESGGSWSMSGEYFKYFKISLDTEKIDALITKYGVDVDEQDPNKKVINSLTPTLEAKNIMENSVTLYPSIPYINADPDYTVNCYIYRSNSENGTYEKISDLDVNCLDSVGIVDEGLKSNTTYYYKTIVDGGTIYSSPLEVTTKGSSNIIDNNTNDNNNSNNIQDDVEYNPNTGVAFPIIIVILALIGSMAVMLYTKKKVFKNTND